MLWLVALEAELFAAVARFACSAAASEEVVMFKGEAAFETALNSETDVLDAASAVALAVEAEATETVVSIPAVEALLLEAVVTPDWTNLQLLPSSYPCMKTICFL